MFKKSKLNIAKQKISELNKKYSKRTVFENSSSETSLDIFVKDRLSKSEESINLFNSVQSNILDTKFAHEVVLTKNKNFPISPSSKSDVNSAESLIHFNSKITSAKEWPEQKLEIVNINKEIPEVRDITPTGVSKRLANVFIISSSDDENISEDIKVGRIVDGPKSFTSTSARTVSEDIISEDGNKKSTPRSIKFVRIDTPIIVNKKEDEIVETSTSSIREEQDLGTASLTSESIRNQIRSDDKRVVSKSSSDNISFSRSELPEIKSNQKLKLLKDSDSMNSSELIISKSTSSDKVKSAKHKTKKVLCKSKCIQTELLIKPFAYSNNIQQKCDIKMDNKVKISVQNRPTLETSNLYRFSHMTDAEINKVSRSISNVYMEDFLEVPDGSSLSLDLIVQQFLKQQVMIIRHIVESNHRLYLSYCKSVHHMCKSDI